MKSLCLVQDGLEELERAQKQLPTALLLGTSNVRELDAWVYVFGEHSIPVIGCGKPDYIGFVYEQAPPLPEAELGVTRTLLTAAFDRAHARLCGHDTRKMWINVLCEELGIP